MRKLKALDYVLILSCFAIIILPIMLSKDLNIAFGTNIDWASQHVVIPEYFRTLFYETGKLIPNFAINLGMGQNIYYFSYYGLLSPIILISYLFPNIPMYSYIEFASITMLLISVFLIYVWLFKKYNTKTAFVGTVIYTLAGPLFFNSHRHIMFVIYMPFLIASLMGVEKYLKNKDPILLMLNVFLMIMTCYYFSVSGIIAIGIYSIYLILKNNKKIIIKDFKPLLEIICYVLISIASAAIILLPTMYTLLNGRLVTNMVISIKDLLKPNIIYNTTFYYHHSLGLTFIYLVSLIWTIFSKKKENIFIGVVLICCMLFPATSYLLNGFMYIDGKCFIPFIPIAVLTICDFLDNLFKEKINLKRLLLMLIPVIIYLIYCGLNDTYLEFMCFDILMIYTGLLLVKLFNKPNILIIPIFAISFMSYINLNQAEKYITNNDIEAQNDPIYYKLSNYINTDNNYYRTANNNLILLNENKVYNINELLTTMYSSSSNNNYINFVNNTFQNEIVMKNNTNVSQTYNVLFNIYSGSKYMISNKTPLIGYTKVKRINNITLYKNDDVLPLGYATSKIMSLKEFKTLSYPYTIDALLNYAIVDEKINNIYSSNINIYTDSYKMVESKGMKLQKMNGHYYVKVNDNADAKIVLDKPLDNKILIIRFKMNNRKVGEYCSLNIKINSIKNSLSCSNWRYDNKNTTFEYVLSRTYPMQNIYIHFINGFYDISNLELYTMDYNSVKSIKNNIDEYKIDKNKSTDNHLVGTVNATNNGYFKLTIPYENKGFTAYIDGKKTKIIKMDTAFIGLKITKGNHKIDIIYNTPYLKLGKIISLVGLVSFIIITINQISKKIKKIR